MDQWKPNIAVLSRVFLESMVVDEMVISAK